ncbi:related to PUF4 - member of the PUF protein family [Melanopsichium pennsylvanicum]|uniref:Related to PUF4 - member of the PUF protein family n=2 Tax=Melanopsichium pennsylvanicum TaxID=63383 RepID=A0AAJ4XPC3_9BASI|nr:arm repeat-containing protein [Melanopsichium pennsylvanicum 4]SNX85912.1 related to PUF4 - member of the PUF protein family [Melanopsichium pennsylvanicum]
MSPNIPAKSAAETTTRFESTPRSASLSESTPSILAASQVLAASQAQTAVTSSSQSPVQKPIDAVDTKLDAGSHSGNDSVDDSDIQARIDRKRLEHEKQRAIHQKAFEHQMALLEKQQREEEQNLLLQRLPNNATASAAASAASAPTTPPNEAVAAHPKLAAAIAAAEKENANDPAARAKALSHVYRSMPPSRRQSAQAARSAHELASAVGSMSISANAAANNGRPSRALHNDAAGASSNDAAANTNHKRENLTPVFNEPFLFDDELDNEDSAFVKKYNLNGDDDQFPILIQRADVLAARSTANDGADGQAPVRGADWPKFGGARANSTGIDAVTIPNAAADTTPSSLRASVTSKSPPSQRTPSMGATFGTSASRQQSAFPLPSPSPRLSHTGRSSPALNASFAGVASRQASGTASPSPGIVGLSGEVGRSGGGSRFVNTAVSIPAAAANLKNHNAAAAAAAAAAGGGAAAFPSFNLGAFSGPATGSESPSRFGPYSPSSFDAGDARRGSRPSSGFFDAFNPTAGANAPGSLFPTDKYSMGMVGADDHAKLGGLHGGNAAANAALAKHARKGELDATTQLEDLQGDIFALCKDQHGCRFLQKKLEETNPAHRDMIFSETFTHFAELMTDPFGNYLCQKMLEYCTDEQRNLIVELVAPELVTISLNMHGTRAVQKMIDFLSMPRQIHSIIVALSMNVVTLIKDLNGNHVVQKCLNRLGAEDNQFIYNAVAAHCVEVATHRHGCCVLQRCIDHASESQRVQLVAEITYNALTLVQDPFGNYVVQYVLDLSIPRFTDAVVRQFVGNVCLLSVQKFSSNVIEKCIRVSEPGVRKQLIEELLNRTRLEKLLRDSFANYVVQTSLDYADPVQRMRLVECIRPILPVIRNTPYGKRIQSKLQRDNLDLGAPNGVPYSVLHAAAHQHQQLHAMHAGMRNDGVLAQQQHPSAAGYMGGYAQGMIPPPPPPHMHMGQQQHFGQQPMYGGGSPHMRGGLAVHHNLPPPNFNLQGGGYGSGAGFNANNLQAPMGMHGGGGGRNAAASGGYKGNAGTGGTSGGFGQY